MSNIESYIHREESDEPISIEDLDKFLTIDEKNIVSKFYNAFYNTQYPIDARIISSLNEIEDQLKKFYAEGHLSYENNLKNLIEQYQNIEKQTDAYLDKTSSFSQIQTSINNTYRKIKDLSQKIDSTGIASFFHLIFSNFNAPQVSGETDTVIINDKTYNLGQQLTFSTNAEKEEEETL